QRDVSGAPANPSQRSAAAEPAFLSTDVVGVTLDAADGALPVQREVRVRRALPESSPCDAVRDEGTFAVVPASDTHVDTPARLSVALRPATELGDAAFGTLELQVVDARTKLASAWTPIAGTFVRAPLVSRIECPADASAACTLIGTGLASIAAVAIGPSTFVAPSRECTSDVKNMACREVPHEAHYTLRLEDGQTTLALPDALIRLAGPTPRPLPAATASP